MAQPTQGSSFVRKGCKTAVGSAFAASMLLGLAVPSIAHAEDNTDPSAPVENQVNTFDISWRGSNVDSVQRGNTLTAKVVVNANDAKGAAGSSDRSVKLTATNGKFIKLPTGADKEASTITDDGSTLNLVVKDMKFGTAQTLDVAVVSTGDKGDKVSVTASADGITKKTPEVGITTTEGIDAIFNYSNVTGHFTQTQLDRNTPLSVPLPFSIAVPQGSERISDKVEFDIQLTANNNNTKLLNKDLLSADGFIATGGGAGVPATSSKVGAPKDTKIQFLGNGKYHVTMTGLPTDPAVQAEKGADGKSLGLNSDRIYMITGKFQLTGGLQDITDSYRAVSFSADVLNFKGATASGTALAEDSTQNNKESFVWTVAGSGSSAWSRNSSVPDRGVDYKMAGDWGTTNTNALATGGQGSNWSTAGRVLPGQELISYVDVATPDGTQGSALMFDRTTGAFDGKVRVNVPGIAPADIQLYYSTDNVDPNNTNPNTMKWTTTMPSDPSTVTAVRAQWDPNKVNMSVGRTYSTLSAGVKVKSTAKTGDEIWSFGYIQNAQGTWMTPQSQQNDKIILTQTPDGRYSSTNYIRDMVRIVGSRVDSTTKFDQAAINSGDQAVVNVSGGVQTDSAWKGQIKVQTVLQPGIEYVSADVKPTSVTKNSNGTTTIVWDKVDVDANKSANFKVTVKGTGDSRATTGYYATSTTTNLNPNTSDSLAATTATSRADLSIAFDGTTQLVKTAQQATSVVQSGETQTWKLNVTNKDSLAQQKTDVIDVLPYNGDPEGSKFTGTYKVSDVKVTGDAKDVKVYYTTADAKTLSTDPADESNGGFGAPSALWSTDKPEDMSKVTGIRVVTGSLDVGKAYDINIDWVASDNAIGDLYVNSSGARATDTSLLMLSAAKSNVVSDQSVLKVDKTPEKMDGPITPGSTIKYKATVLNDSDHTATNVKFTETPGNGLDAESVVLSNPEQGTVLGKDWAIGNLAPHAKVTVDVEVKVSEDWKGTDIVNQVNVSNPSNPPKATCHPNATVEEDDDQCDVVTITENSKLKIDKAIVTPEDKLLPGGDVEYKLVVRNDGPDTATGVVVTDKPKDGLDADTIAYVDGSQSKGEFKGKTWTIGELKAGEEATITVKGKLAKTLGEKKVIENAASVESPWHPLPGTCNPNKVVGEDDDQCDIVSTPINPELKVDKAIGDVSKKKVGDTVEYTITAKNSGKTLASNVVVTDKPGKGIKDVKFTDKSQSQGTFDGLDWKVGTLKPGQVVTAKVTATLTEDAFDGTVNDVIIQNPWLLVSPDANQVNKTVDEDKDQFDSIVFTIAKPAVPPSDNGGAPPAPSDGDDKPTPVAVKTGGDGMTGTEKAATSLFGMILAGGLVAGSAAWIDSRRKKKAGN